MPKCRLVVKLCQEEFQLVLSAQKGTQLQLLVMIRVTMLSNLAVYTVKSVKDQLVTCLEVSKFLQYHLATKIALYNWIEHEVLM